MNLNFKRINILSKAKIYAAIIIFTLLLILLETHGTFKFGEERLFRLYDNRLYDIFHVMEGEKKPPQHVALVTIDKDTFRAFRNEPIIAWGPHFAKAIRTLKNIGASTVGVDIFFGVSLSTWFGESVKHEPEEELSAESQQEFGEVVEEFSRSYDSVFLSELSDGGVTIVCSFLEKSGHAEMILPERDYQTVLPGGLNDIGIANLVYEDDGIVRRYINSFFSSDRPPYLSFAALLAQKHLGKYDKEYFPPGLNNIYYYGPPGTFPSVPFWKFIKKSPDAEIDPDYDPTTLPEIQALKDKVIIIAYAKDTKQDMQQTIYSVGFMNHSATMMSGGEVHANIVETILSKDFYLEMPRLQKILYILFFSIISAVTYFYVRNIVGIISLSCFLLLNTYIAKLFFDEKIFIPVTAVFIVIVTNYFFSLLTKFSQEEKKSKHIRNIFSHLVSPQVVDKMIDSGEIPSLGGEMKEVTVLFSDIRNFTTISEMLEPHEVVEMLNEYFERICVKILELEGFVNKFIGDAIMVIFGAPLYYEDHAERALIAAEAINDEAIKFRDWMDKKFGEKYKHLPEFNIGVGLHTGEAIIGLVGSKKRFEFTAIGDVVNIASRLEGLTKETKSNIVMSSEHFNNVKKAVNIGSRVMTKVKGKSKEIEVIEFISFNTEKGKDDEI